MPSKTWDPIREMEALLRGWSPTSSAAPRVGHEVMTTADWAPAVDIAEADDEYVINVELPEVDKANVNVTARDGVLSIAGQRPRPGTDGITFHRIERGHGSFARSFSLPDNVEAENIRAEHRDGMLFVHLPKHKETPPKAIQIQVK